MAHIKRAASPPPSPPPKTARTRARSPPSPSAGGAPAPAPIVCTLPPTCHPPRRPTALASSAELEAHYARFHAHVCELRGCGCVFPDARLLELHQTECHDPLAAVRKDRGEKIFACHLATCPRKFSTPKTRRMHLIQAHGYPKEYFFAVTNKGIGGLLSRWGGGASMLRKAWQAREPAGDAHDRDSDDDAETQDEDDVLESIEEGADAGATETEEDDDEDDDDDEVLLEKIHIPAREAPATDTEAPVATSAPAPHSDEKGHKSHPRHKPRDRQRESQRQNKARNAKSGPDTSIDALAQSLDALSLVPTSVQFGRGARNRTVPNETWRDGGRGDGRGTSMDVDHPHGGANTFGRGNMRARRGRGTAQLGVRGMSGVAMGIG
ncbi:uncharacterized protein BXZ73DRAFT_89138 [Epithele typhae]|uniref:uncharacterized protein n=1 Tax=Epithele typhae TaxID=378194 RepID=UPI002007D5CE|nr:uncharacterized protein BXZ73DRAFT_89138 [Epithele typhae]KAH9939065.1 hypothetical protein BXZ73DRAFT_89138 [Epithele typhae]